MPGASSSARSSPPPRSSSRAPSRRCGRPGIRCTWGDSASGRCARPPGSRTARSRASVHARSLRGTPRTRWSRSRRRATASFGLVLAMLGHAVGWPLPRGGSQALADALASYLRSLGGEIETGRTIASLAELRGVPTVLLDVTPRQFLALAGDRLSGRYRRGARALPLRPRRLQGRLRALGAGAVAGGRVRAARRRCTWAARSRRSPRPRRRWRVAASASARTSSSRSRASSTRLARPTGRHTLWAYTHVPNGSTADALPGDRGPARALRSRFHGSRARAERARPGCARGPQPELRREATSTAAAPTCASCSRGRWRA